MSDSPIQKNVHSKPQRDIPAKWHTARHLWSQDTNMVKNITACDCTKYQIWCRAWLLYQVWQKETVIAQSSGVPPDPSGNSMLLAAGSISESALINTMQPNPHLIKCLFNMMAFSRI